MLQDTRNRTTDKNYVLAGGKIGIFDSTVVLFSSCCCVVLSVKYPIRKRSNRRTVNIDRKKVAWQRGYLTISP